MGQINGVFQIPLQLMQEMTCIYININAKAQKSLRVAYIIKYIGFFHPEVEAGKQL